MVRKVDIKKVEVPKVELKKDLDIVTDLTLPSKDSVVPTKPSVKPE